MRPLELERSVLAPGQVAAGASVSVPVPSSERQVLLAVSFRLTTSAVVATRTPIVSITDGSGIAIVSAAAGFGATANTAADFTFAVGLSEWDQAGNVVASGPVPEMPLREGDNIVISVNGVDAGDQLSRVRVTLAQASVRPLEQ